MLIIMLLIMLLLTLLIMLLLMLLIMLLLMLLIVLVREFESRRGEISNILAKKKGRKRKDHSCSERQAWVSTIRRESTRGARAEIFSR